MQPTVCEVLDAVKGAGLTVLRTWAFGEGSEWNALQPEAGACPLLCTALCAVLGLTGQQSQEAPRAQHST